MLVKNQIVQTTWNSSTQKYYQSKGYEFTGRGTPFLVKIEDLPKGSHAKVKVICDYCGKEYEKTYKDYFSQHENGDCCKECEGKKSTKVVEQKYGKGSKHKHFQEYLDKYKVKNAMHIPENVDKVKKTNIDKYGVSTVLCLPENKTKAIEASWTESARKTREETNLSIYGSKYPLSNSEVRKKIAKSYYKYGNTMTSKAQWEIYNILLERYGECELNYKVGCYLLDCFLVVEGQKLDVEYNGIYWHKPREKQDESRNQFLINKGYKVLNFIGKTKTPSKEIILDSIEKILTNEEKIMNIFVE